jgi:hypothetical protein
MRKHIPHPVTRRTSAFPELDILHGGDEISTIEESLVIARDLREVLRDGEGILYVNTLINMQRLEHMMGKRFDHGARRGRNHFVTYMPDHFIDKLPAIEAIIEAKGIRYLVLNSFELATLSSRHRAVFMAWIRSMRNRGVNVILFTMSCPGRIGALGALRFTARTMNEVGAYLKAIEEESDEIMRSADDAISDDIAEDSELIIQFSDMQDNSKLYTGTPIIPNQHSDSDPSKTKDLALEMV